MSDRKRKFRQIFGCPGLRTSGSRRRTIGQNPLRPRILIVCEGAKTEPSYFLSFHVTNDVHGKGMETIRVVDEAERLNDAEGPFDQVWCVFDRDSFPAADFDNAIHKVQSLTKKGFRVAYSNESFELWYLLHFEYLNAALTREQYNQKLEKHLDQKYLKGNPDNYRLIQEMGNETQAICNAERLQDLYSSDIPYSKRSPATTVCLLVKELRRIKDERLQS